MTKTDNQKTWCVAQDSAAPNKWYVNDLSGSGGHAVNDGFVAARDAVSAAVRKANEDGYHVTELAQVEGQYVLILTPFERPLAI